MNTIQTAQQNDISHIWTRFNFRWLATGIASGLGAALVVLVFAAYLSTFIEREPTFPSKLIGAAFFGPSSMQMDTFGIGASTGLLIHFALAAFFGLTFAQFVIEESRKRMLILLGTLASLAVWLFWSAMFMPTFNEAMAFLMPKSISLLLHAVFGLSFGLFIVFLRPFLAKK